MLSSTLLFLVPGDTFVLFTPPYFLPVFVLTFRFAACHGPDFLVMV